MDDRADVASTLNELERKLKALEGDLQAAAQPPVIDPGPAPVAEPQDLGPVDDALTGDPQQIVAEARRRIADLRAELDELAQTREQLARTASELVEDYNRALAEAPPPQQPEPQAPAPTPAPAPAQPSTPASAQAPAPAPLQPPTPAPVASYPAQPPAYEEPQPQATLGPEHTLQQGNVTIDAGFFRDVTSLSTFEQSLARIPGVAGIVVRGFAQGRAQIDVQLSQPVALGSELIRHAPLRMSVTEAGPQHLMLAIAS